MPHLILVLTCLISICAYGEGPERLPGTDQLELNEPLDIVMVRGVSQHAEQELIRSRNQRNASWIEDNTQAAVIERLKSMIGVLPLAENAQIWNAPVDSSDAVRAFKFDVSPGITGEGLHYLPAKSAGVRCILLGDAGYPSSETISRLLKRGMDVYCLLLIDREAKYSGHPNIRYTNMPHREFVYRAGFNLGLHVIGYEVSKTLQLANLLQSSDQPVLLMGEGEGGLLALWAGAIGQEAFDAVAIRGYFGPREQVWQEPIYRNVYGQLKEFGDAELASLIAPRPLAIDQEPTASVSGPPEPQQGQAPYAAPGAIEPPTADEVTKEFKRAQRYFEKLKADDRIGLVQDSESALNWLAKQLSLPNVKSDSPSDVVVPEPNVQPALDEMIRHTQATLASCDKVRSQLWADATQAKSVEQWKQLDERYRDLVHDTFIGRLSKPSMPANPRSRKIIEEETHVGYEVVLDVYDGVIAGGVLLIPNGIQNSERRPVVVCQHGLEGIPGDTITTDETSRAFRAYKGFATDLVKQGYVVYAPQNPYRGFDEFRVIQRKANPLGRSLFSYIVEQHRQTLQWLGALPYVDPNRIAFYGLSYGGKTAMRVPALLPPTDEEVGYCLSICSADFNEWIRKNASTEDRYSYVFTREYEIFEWNMGHVANYAELAYLIAPRPFMVERGHHDGVAPDEWVGWEFAKIRRFYTQLGIPDETQIEWFDGPHTINGVGTYQFLGQQLGR